MQIYLQMYHVIVGALEFTATKEGCDLKLSGTSPYLSDILETKSESSKISLKNN